MVFYANNCTLHIQFYPGMLVNIHDLQFSSGGPASRPISKRLQCTSVNLLLFFNIHLFRCLCCRSCSIKTQNQENWGSFRIWPWQKDHLPIQSDYGEVDADNILQYIGESMVMHIRLNSIRYTEQVLRRHSIPILE